MKLGIRASSLLNAQGVYKNGGLVFENSEAQPFAAYAREVYRYLSPGYAKFFKMDELCKLAFLAGEVLLADLPLHGKGEEGEKVAIILGNKSSSIMSDRAHFQTYHDPENYFPSPAVFVYTLPNIMLGELCIRHQVSGENSCFLMPEPQPGFLFRYVQELFEKEDYEYCITGWVDFHPQHYMACMVLVEKWADDRALLRTFDEQFISIASV